MNRTSSRILTNTILSAIALLFFPSNTFPGEQASRKTSMFNKQWLDAVVSVEQERTQQNPDGTIEVDINPQGTGFLVETENNHLVLVIAKHLVTDLVANDRGIFELKTKNRLRYRLNETRGPAYLVDDQELKKNGLGEWFLAEKGDVAIRFMEWKHTTKFAMIRKRDFIPRADLQGGGKLADSRISS